MRKITLFFAFAMLSFISMAQDRIYYGNWSYNISSCRIDGTDNQVVLAASQGIYDMEVDFYNDEMYWGAGGIGLKKANTDGTGETVLVSNTGTIGGVALDLKNGKVYYTVIGITSSLYRCNLDGTSPETIVPSINNFVYNLAYSENLQKIYFTGAQQGGVNNFVYRCNQDGTGFETLLTTTDFIPGLSIDDENQKIYLAYWQINEVRQTDMTCSYAPTLVFGSSNGTFQIAVSNIEQKIYFAEMATNKIRKANLDGTDPVDIITTISQPMSLAIPTVPPSPTMMQDNGYTFDLYDFLFSGMDQDLLTKIQIVETVNNGTLYLDANSNDVVDAGEVVEASEEIMKTDFALVKFIPDAGEYGTPYTYFTYKWFDGTAYSTEIYRIDIYVIQYIAGDVNENGIIDGDEITGDVNNDGDIDRPSEVAGDADGDGVIDEPTEIAGDVNGDGEINRPSEVAGDLNGNGVIDRPEEIAGDTDGDGGITSPEVNGDTDGDHIITNPELLGDSNGNGVLDDGETAIEGLNSREINVFPTVTEGYVYIQFNENVKVTVTDLSGKTVLTTNEKIIDLKSFGQGLYLINAVSESSTKRVKVLVK